MCLGKRYMYARTYRLRHAASRLPTVKQDNVIRQRHLYDTFLQAESKINFGIGNRDVTISQNTNKSVTWTPRLRVADPTVACGCQQRQLWICYRTQDRLNNNQ